MKTSDYPYFKLPFDEFNVAQATAIPFVDKDVNMVVSFSTAVGKTAIAECAFGYHLSQDSGVCVYVSPLKGLSSEKYDSWKSGQFGKFGVASISGEKSVDLKDLDKSRVVVITAESFDSRVRNPLFKDWVKSISCVVYDEAHMIGDDSRGSSYECSAIRLSKINPSARIILLSATLSNGLEVGKWVKSLNGKETKLVRSSWSPNKMVSEYHFTTLRNRMDKCMEVIEGIDPNEKAIIFVHSKLVGKSIQKSLAKKGISSLFHNASLSKKKREEIEFLFSSKISGYNILISTSTLGAGVNL